MMYFRIIKLFYKSHQGAISIEYGLGLVLLAIIMATSFRDTIPTIRGYMFCVSVGCERSDTASTQDTPKSVSISGIDKAKFRKDSSGRIFNNQTGKEVKF
jgi:Flp pilus assembly pilin Flp